MFYFCLIYKVQWLKSTGSVVSLKSHSNDFYFHLERRVHQALRAKPQTNASLALVLFLLHSKEAIRLFLTSQSLAVGSSLQLVMCKSLLIFFHTKKKSSSVSKGPIHVKKNKMSATVCLTQIITSNAI